MITLLEKKGIGTVGMTVKRAQKNLSYSNRCHLHSFIVLVHDMAHAFEDFVSRRMINHVLGFESEKYSSNICN